MTQENVEIRALPWMRLAALEHRGSYPEIGKTFEKLTKLFTESNLWIHAHGMVAVYFDDPSAVPAEELRSAAGIVVEEDFVIPMDMQEIWTGGVRCAVLHYKGPYSGLPAAWHGFYCDWLPTSGETMSGIPSFEIYRNDPTDTPEDDLLTDICVPLRAIEG